MTQHYFFKKSHIEGLGKVPVGIYDLLRFLSGNTLGAGVDFFYVASTDCDSVGKISKLREDPELDEHVYN